MIHRDDRLIGGAAGEYGRYDGRHLTRFQPALQHGMPVYEYELSEIVCCMHRHGIQTLTMQHTDHSGLHGVWIAGERS